jgi:hypothetical protein
VPISCEKSHDNSANITNPTSQNDDRQSIPFEEPSPTLVDESSHIKHDIDAHVDGDKYSESTTTTGEDNDNLSKTRALVFT